MYHTVIRIIALSAILIGGAILLSFTFNGGGELAEPYIELVNLALVTVTLFIGLILFERMAGPLRTAVININVVLFLFWTKELIAVLNDFSFINWPGSIADFIELLMIVALLLAMSRLMRLI